MSGGHLVSRSLNWTTRRSLLGAIRRMGVTSYEGESTLPSPFLAAYSCNLARSSRSRNELFYRRRSSSVKSDSSSSTIEDVDADAANVDSEVLDDSKKYGKYQPRPWEHYYQALVEFQNEQGHCNIQPGSTTDPSLVYFVKKQKRNREALSEAQIRKLDKIGFVWETGPEKLKRQWREKFDQLVEYQRIHGDCDVPSKYEQNISLGRWVERQRRLNNQGDLPRDRFSLLDEIGFKWTVAPAPPRDTSTYDKKWRRQFMKVVDFVRHHGHCVIPIRYDEDPSLGNWVAAQRGLERKGVLRPDRKEELESIGFVFDIDNTNATESILQQQWDDMFQRLLEYRDDNGHVNVPHAYQGHNGLGGWVAQQRKQEKRGKLEDARHRRLIEIGFEFGQNREEKWLQKYEELREFQSVHGHCNVSVNDNKTLASWVFSQRTLYKDGKLSTERQSKLEDLGFVWQLRNRLPRKTGNDADDV